MPKVWKNMLETCHQRSLVYATAVLGSIDSVRNGAMIPFPRSLETYWPTLLLSLWQARQPSAPWSDVSLFKYLSVVRCWTITCRWFSSEIIYSRTYRYHWGLYSCIYSISISIYFPPLVVSDPDKRILYDRQVACVTCCLCYQGNARATEILFGKTTDSPYNTIMLRYCMYDMTRTDLKSD